MWEFINEDNRKIYALDIDETFEDLSDEEKKLVYESAIDSRRVIEAEFAKVLGEASRLVESLTEEEWAMLPKKVCDFLLQYKKIEEDDD